VSIAPHQKPPLVPYGFQPLQCYPHLPTVRPSQLHHTSQWFYRRSFPAHPGGMPRLASTTYYTRPYPYRLSWVYYFHAWSLHEPVLRFGYDNKLHASSITPDKVLNCRHNTETVPILSPQILFSTLIATITINIDRVTQV
jgi:hypothetical protein